MATMVEAVVDVKTKTFRRQALERDFIGYCQLSTESSQLPLSSTEMKELREKAEDFIDSAEFRSRQAEGILGQQILDECREAAKSASKRRISLPPHLATLCEDELLGPQQERELFRRLNYLKFRAEKILNSSDSLGQWDIERIQGLLRAAEWHRDVIVRANVRLVISIVKKFVNPQCSFDDLLSDGIMALIRSVDKFDYQLGFRFSTYATQVVRRNSYRYVMNRQDERLKVTNSLSEPGLDLQDDQGGSSMSEQRWHALRSKLTELLGELDKRERFIIRARFSLGGHRRKQTLQKLADRLGISKERVRQIEKRAMEKLHQMAQVNPVEVAEVES